MANISISGVTKTIRGQYTNTLGWLPGVAVVDVPPGSYSGAIIVAVSFTDDTRTVTLADCKVFRAKTIQGESGAVTRLWIKDRRWRWLWGHISGTYNIPKNDGTLWSATEKTPRELMALVLDALGETGYDVSSLPNTHRPFVSWEAAIPAVVGDAICREAGCDIAFNPFTNTVSIVQLGAGVLPTFDGAQSISNGFSLADLPSQVIAIADRSTYQAKWKLAARGINRNGAVVDVDSLDYKPTGGWTEEDDPENLLTGEDISDQSLANDSVFRLFEATTLADDSLDLPGYGTLSNRERALPIRDTLNDSWQTTQGADIDKAPFVEGIIAVRSDLVGLENTDIERIDEPFSIDNETGLIKTRRPMFKLADSPADGIDFPELYLTVACYVQDADRRFHRHSVSRSIAGAPASPPAVLRVEDVRLQKTAVYDTDGTTLLSVTSNQTAVEARLNAEIDAYVTSLVTSVSQSVRMSGIRLIATSGLVREVTWRCSIRAANEDNCIWTFAAVNTEADPGVVQAAERVRRLNAADSLRRLRVRDVERYRRRHGKRDVR